MDNNNLFNLIRSGCENAFTELFKTRCEYVLYVAMRYYNIDDAQDIVQDVFLSIWANRAKLPDVRSDKSFLTRSVINACLDRLDTQRVKNKRAARYARLIETSCCIPDKDDNQRLKTVKRVIDSTPMRTWGRTAFNMHFIDGVKHRAIAATLGVPEQTVRNRVHKTLQILREKLKHRFYAA